MGYVVGTESESAIFAGNSIEYGPAGTIPAVDAPDSQRSGSPALGYAICGTPVRVWPQAVRNTTFIHGTGFGRWWIGSSGGF